MQPDDGWTLVLVKMARNGVSNLLAQCFDRLCLCEYRVPKRAGLEPPFKGFFHQENNLTHGVTVLIAGKLRFYALCSERASAHRARTTTVLPCWLINTG